MFPYCFHLFYIICVKTEFFDTRLYAQLFTHDTRPLVKLLLTMQCSDLNPEIPTSGKGYLYIIICYSPILQSSL